MKDSKLLLFRDLLKLGLENENGCDLPRKRSKEEVNDDGFKKWPKGVYFFHKLSFCRALRYVVSALGLTIPQKSTLRPWDK